MFFSERNNFLVVSWVKKYDFEVDNPGPQEPTIRLLNFDLEILMLILGQLFKFDKNNLNFSKRVLLKY
ncbi:hypothetical protein BpHYR1_017155 [Brachionus plicatilis]|uniref:Uncharacterized protein n=1 Tax=Brachionus plicatilis TaxID=10195 RepID=A0A3M7Q8L2_BRAPC|nr:hypothetical protein BpHYR1_017155 [Brachionus plicatilis]